MLLMRCLVVSSGICCQIFQDWLKAQICGKHCGSLEHSGLYHCEMSGPNSETWPKLTTWRKEPWLRKRPRTQRVTLSDVSQGGEISRWTINAELHRLELYWGAVKDYKTQDSMVWFKNWALTWCGAFGKSKLVPFSGNATKVFKGATDRDTPS